MRIHYALLLLALIPMANAYNWTLVHNDTSVSYWTGIALSSNGQIAYLSGDTNITHSTDGGTTWSNCTFPTGYTANSIVISTTGTKLVVGNTLGFVRPIVLSTDSCATWTAAGPAGYSARPTNGAPVCSSDNGVNLAGIFYQNVPNYEVWTSDDSGATWNNRTTLGRSQWYSIACDSTGTKLAVVDHGHTIHTSNDSGATWTNQTASGSRHWGVITSSSTGKYLAAGIGAGDTGGVFTSDSYGTSWTAQVSGIHSWTLSAVPNGSIIVGCDQIVGYCYTSTDYGVTWTDQLTARGQPDWMTKPGIVPNGSIIFVGTLGEVWKGVAPTTPASCLESWQMTCPALTWTCTDMNACGTTVNRSALCNTPCGGGGISLPAITGDNTTFEEWESKVRILQMGAKQIFSQREVFSLKANTYLNNLWLAPTEVLTSTNPMHLCRFKHFDCAIYRNHTIILTYPKAGQNVTNTPFDTPSEQGYICPTRYDCYHYTATYIVLNLNWRIPYTSKLDLFPYISPNGINLWPLILTGIAYYIYYRRRAQ